MSKAHAKFPPSGADRWVECGASIALGQKVPPGPDSKYSIEGTTAHDLLEKLLNGEPFRAGDYTKDMIEHGRDAVAEVKRRTPKGAKVFAESKADLTFIDKDFWGTADITIVEDFGRLSVGDYKYGYALVDAKDNRQLLAYGLAKAYEHDFNFKEVCLFVIQPRVEDDDGQTVREWVIPISRVKQAWKEFAAAIKIARGPDAPFKAGEHCKYCPGKIICPEQSSKALKAAQIDFDEGDDGGKVSLPSAIPSLLPQGEKLGNWLAACDKIENWISALREYAFHQLNRGHKVPGFKLVAKRSTRKWKDLEEIEKAAKKKFGDKAFSHDLLSPAQLEKIAGKEFVSRYSSSESSGLTLVPESDKREASTPALDDFSEIETKKENVKNGKTASKTKI